MFGDLISVIVPVYNVQKWLNKCVDSILGQTYENLEVILVDDGSPDRCGEICDEYAKMDARVKVIHQENARQGAARNNGLNIAKGEYIAFVDSDDYIAPDMYEKMLSELIKHNADMAVCGYYSITPYQEVASCTNDGALVMDNHKAMKSYYEEALIGGAPWNKLYKRELWEEIRFLEKIFREDEYIFYRVLAKSQKTVHIGEAKYYYNVREGSSEHSGFDARYMISVESIDRQLSFAEENYPELRESVMNGCIRTRYDLVERIVLSGQFKKYEKEYRELTDFLKNNRETAMRLEKRISRFIKYGKITFVPKRFRLKIKLFVKKTLRFFGVDKFLADRKAK